MMIYNISYCARIQYQFLDKTPRTKRSQLAVRHVAMDAVTATLGGKSLVVCCDTFKDKSVASKLPGFAVSLCCVFIKFENVSVAYLSVCF